MKSFKLSLVFLTGLLLLLSSCTKRLITEEKAKKANYDTAAFNFIYVEALKQKLSGNLGDALKYLEQSIKIKPESDASYYQIAQILIANGDVKNGKHFALKAMSLNDKNLWYLTMMAGLYYQEKNIDSAIFCYEKAVKYYPDKENLKLALGNLYSENKNFDKANTIFESFDNKYGVNEKSTLSSIKSLMAEKKYDQALEKEKALLKEYPDDIMYNGIMADIYREKGDKKKAMDVYRNLLEQNPGNPQVELVLSDFLINEKSYYELFEILNTILLNEKIEKDAKISLLGRIIELQDLGKENTDKLFISLIVLEANYKDDNIVPLLRPELLIKENRLDEASKRLEEIIKEKPDDYYAWEKMLIVYLQQKNYDKLFAKGEECASSFNTSFVAKLLYANGALEKEKYNIALEELKKAEILAVDNKEEIIQVLTMRADVYYRMKDYGKAFETYEAALKTNDKDLTVMNNYAYYLAEQNTKLKEAEEMSRLVIEKEKGNTTYLDTYGWILYKRNKLQEAAKIMESIINSKEHPDAVWYEHYGYILEKQKKCKEAVEIWKTALKLDSTKTKLIKEIENCKE
jgi:predicted Zn-dependent protease